MTVKGSEITLDKLVMMVLGGACTIIIAATAFFMRDMVETMKALQSDVASIKTEMKFSREEMRRIEDDQDELRQALYGHIRGRK